MRLPISLARKPATEQLLLAAHHSEAAGSFQSPAPFSLLRRNRLAVVDRASTLGGDMRTQLYRLLLLATVLLPAAAGTQVPASTKRARDTTNDGCEQGFLKRGAKCVAVSAATGREIRALLIAESLAEYYGSCPCPYNVDRAGRSCGRRSAYSRPGGRAPRCYDADVSDAEVKAFRERNRPRPPA